MVVADPVAEVAQRIANDCKRLTKHTVTTTTGEDTIKAIKRYKPQIVVLSLELQTPSILEVANTIRKQMKRCVAIGTYRELSIPTIEQLKKENIVEFVAHRVSHDASPCFFAFSSAHSRKRASSISEGVRGHRTRLLLSTTSGFNFLGLFSSQSSTSEVQKTILEVVKLIGSGKSWILRWR